MKLRFILLAFLLTFGLVGCSETNNNDLEETPSKDETPVVVEDEENTDDDDEEVGDDSMIKLTLEQLSEYNGKDGNLAYIAVNGVIYDVSNVSAWTNGAHNGVSAGNDVSTFINGAPHGTSVLSDLEAVGELID